LVIDAATSVLSLEERCRIIDGLSKKNVNYEIVSQLVGTNRVCFRHLIKSHCDEWIKLHALNRTFDDTWMHFAEECIEAGIEPRKIAGASTGAMSWEGDLSKHLTEMLDQLARVASTSPKVREVAEFMRDRLKRQRDKAIVDEHDEDVFGRDTSC